MDNKNIEIIEDEVDKYLYNLIDDSIPRYKYIYHINLAYINFVIENKLWFSSSEKYIMNSLNYNIFLAYKKLKEEDKTSFEFDSKVYHHCISNLLRGLQYAILCEVFPAIRSEMLEVEFINEKEINVQNKDYPRSQYEFFLKYILKKSLSYELQMSTGILINNKEKFEDIPLRLTESYLKFWNENLNKDDFEEYTMLDWGGVNYFLITACMRRFLNLYINDFDIYKVGCHKTMIILSNNGNKIKDFIPSGDEKELNKVLEDLVYKPIGNNLFPKSNVQDAPIIVTKDGYLMINPLIVLSNESVETMYLNNLRKVDNKRYLIMKDKIKERSIPLIEAFIKAKYQNVKVITNFNLPIPNKKGKKRELDILIIDSNGYALYIEVKHFFNPSSFSEIKNLDSQLRDSLTKMPDQLLAISENWDLIKNVYSIDWDLTQIKGIIHSHSYLGRDVEINDSTPIVNLQNFIESLVEANTIEELYECNKEIDTIYTTLPIVKKAMEINYGSYIFNLSLEAIRPDFETLFLLEYRKNVLKNIDMSEKTVYKSIEEHAHFLINKLEQLKSNE